MSNKIIIRSSLKDIKNFNELPVRRKGIIEESSKEKIVSNYAVNSIGNFLHPPTQYLKIKQVGQITKNIRAYVLTPDASRGTAKLAYFRPGQAINVTVNINGNTVTRAYTLCSSPNRSTNDEYVIIVKAKENGYASKYIINNWKKGTELIASEPFGEFYYQPLRDSKNIIGICDNVGFAPFLSMAEAVCDKTLNINFTLLYAARKENDAVLSERFDQLAELCSNFKVVYILSDEFIHDKERGFITKTLIEKYAPIGKFSVFVNGSESLLNKTLPQINDLHLDKKYIRLGAVTNNITPEKFTNFPKDNSNKTFLCKVIYRGKEIATIPCPGNECLLSAIEKENLPLDFNTFGVIRFNRAQLKKGEVYIPPINDLRRNADKIYNYIYLSDAFPKTDLTIELY